MDGHRTASGRGIRSLAGMQCQSVKAQKARPAHGVVLGEKRGVMVFDRMGSYGFERENLRPHRAPIFARPDREGTLEKSREMSVINITNAIGNLRDA